MAEATTRTIVLRTSTRNRLLHGAAACAVLLSGAAAHAAEQTASDCVKKCAHAAHHRRRHVAARPVENPLAGEVEALRAEVAALEQRLDASNAAAQQAQAAAGQAQAAASAAQAAAQNDQLAINEIPGQVNAAVAALPKPPNDGWYFKGVKFIPGGFIAAESVYRTRGLGSDFSVPFGGIPFENTNLKAAHTAEWRQTARQSRVSGLAVGDPTPDVRLSAYGEFDFLGAAQTANSNESNSYNLRIRHLYTTVDLKSEGFSILAGQNWSLATLNDLGITPRNEVIPSTIDSQYVVGFVWARQPQLRLTENFGNGFWAAVSAENPQTNSLGGSPALLPGFGSVVFNQLAQSGSLFNAAVPYSFNHAPDVIGKVAWDNSVDGHHLHVEGFGIFRQFTDRIGTGCNASGANCAAFHNATTSGGGGGFGVIAQLAPGVFDAQASGLFGSGLGRYGSGQLSDVFERDDGELEGIRESLWLAGLTFHATKAIDFWAYYGQERQSASAYFVDGTPGGYGNPLFSNLGTAASPCEIGPTTSACNGNTKLVQEATVGIWGKAYSGDFGSFRLGLQYAFVKRSSFSGIVDAGAPNATPPVPPAFGQVTGDDNMIYTSIRYYPFQR